MFQKPNVPKVQLDKIRMVDSPPKIKVLKYRKLYILIIDKKCGLKLKASEKEAIQRL